jgi:hypothetical protein
MSARYPRRQEPRLKSGSLHRVHTGIAAKPPWLFAHVASTHLSLLAEFTSKKRQGKRVSDGVKCGSSHDAGLAMRADTDASNPQGRMQRMRRWNAD